MGSSEEERGGRSRGGPIITSIPSHAVSLAKSAAAEGAEGIGRKEPSSPSHASTWVEFRVGGSGLGTPGRVPKLGERQAECIVGTGGMEDIQRNGGQDPGGSETTRRAA